MTNIKFFVPKCIKQKTLYIKISYQKKSERFQGLITTDTNKKIHPLQFPFNSLKTFYRENSSNRGSVSGKI